MMEVVLSGIRKDVSYGFIAISLGGRWSDFRTSSFFKSWAACVDSDWTDPLTPRARRARAPQQLCWMNFAAKISARMVFIELRGPPVHEVFPLLEATAALRDGRSSGPASSG